MIDLSGSRIIMNREIWLDSYDPQVPHHLKYPVMNLYQLFEQSVEKYSKSIFVTDRARDYTFLEIKNAVDNFAIELMEKGVKKGDKVCMVLFNEIHFVIAYYSILKVGGVIVALNPLLKNRELIDSMNRADTQWYVGYRREWSIENLRRIGKFIRHFFIVNNDDTFPPLPVEISDIKTSAVQFLRISDFRIRFSTPSIQKGLPFIRASDPAIFQFSGGTTGTPKIAIGLHKNIVANTYQFRAWLHALEEGKETILAAIPLFHVYGMVIALNLGVFIGARIVCLSAMSPIESLVRTIRNYKITVIPGVPNQYYGIVEYARKIGVNQLTNSLKICISGSTPLNNSVKENFELLMGCKIIEGYGLSEAPTATHCNPMQGNNKEGSIGLPLPDVACKLISIDGKKKNDPSEGELVIRSPQVMKGYYKNAPENHMVLRNRWLYTGDVARMDTDGYFYLIDRIKDVIKVGGFQVWPREIEIVLIQHPNVKEVSVAGVKDRRQGEKAIAWIVPVDEQKMTQKDLQEWCDSFLPRYKVPAEFIFVNKLPRSAVGKVLRHELAKQYGQQ